MKTSNSCLCHTEYKKIFLTPTNLTLTGMHHFEVRVTSDPLETGVVPPMIALTTASPYDPPRESNFQLDLLRFWPRNEG